MLSLIWFSDFRGEDLNVRVYDVQRTDGRQVMTKAYMAFVHEKSNTNMPTNKQKQLSIKLGKGNKIEHRHC